MNPFGMAPASFFTLVLLSMALIFGLFVIFSLGKTEYIIYTLLIWFPVETLVLRYTPPDYFVLVRYFPEIMMYSTLVISWSRYIKKTDRFFPRTPINKWLLLLLIVAALSYIANWYNPLTWLFGVRQVLRFVVIFIIFLLENYSTDVIKTFLWIGVFVIVGESILGIVQYASSGALDKYLFFRDSISVGKSVQIQGIEQFWAPGQRVFATMGRYDRLGSLLAIGLIMLFPWFYILKDQEQRDRWWVAFILGVVALILTYSRASWIAFICGMFTIGYFLVRDRRIFKLASTAGALIVLYLLFVIITQSYGSGTVDQLGKDQSIRDRLVEMVSPYSWKQSYEGYGRIFFIINTPLTVVWNYPMLGVGPGNYGGGVAASLGNKLVYDKLHLPFGIQNVYGQIDNNWLSIWGETGTLGLLVWILLFREIFQSAYFVQRKTKDEVQKTVAQGLCGVTVAVVILGFFGPYFEFRTLMLYFWLIVGIALYYFREHIFAWNFLRE